MPDLEQRKYITLREVNKMYGIPLSTLRRWASERRFPLYKVSNRIFVKPEQFQEWFERGGSNE